MKAHRVCVVGELERRVLAALSQAPKYGATVGELFKAVRSQLRRVKLGTFYRCMRGLLDKGLIASPKARYTNRAGRPSRVYTLTQKGDDLVEALRADADELWHGARKKAS